MWDDGDVTSAKLEDLNKFRKDRLNKAARLGFGPLAHQVRKSRSRSRERMRKVIDNAPRAPVLKQQIQQRQAMKRLSTDDEDLDAFLAHKPPKGAIVQKAAAARMLAEAAGRLSHQPGKYVQNEPRYEPSSDALLASAAASAAAYRSETPQVTTVAAFARKDEPLVLNPTDRKAIAVSSGARAKAGAARPPSSVHAGTEEPQEHDSRLEYGQYEGEEGSDVGSDEVDKQNGEKQRLKDEKRKRNQWRKKWRMEKKKRRVRERAGQDDSVEEDSSDRDSSSQERDAEHIEKKMRELKSEESHMAKSSGQKKHIGQWSDKDLEKRFKEQEAEDKGAKLMSESEVLAKIQRNSKRR